MQSGSFSKQQINVSTVISISYVAQKPPGMPLAAIFSMLILNQDKRIWHANA
jgi:hypothetical protein